MHQSKKYYFIESNTFYVHYIKCTNFQCSLHIVPDYGSYNWLDTNDKNNLKLKNPTKYLNASLAIQLAHNWMTYKELYKKYTCRDILDKNSIITDLPLKTFVGLESSFWPGRCQVLNMENEDYYLDGAHTAESMSVCSRWFKNHSRFVFVNYYITKI